MLAPAWQAPDEIEHFAYAQRLAETREPTNDSGAFLRGYSTEHQYAMESALTNTVRQNPKGKPPWEDGSRAAWEKRDDREHPSKKDGNRAILSYTPAYYSGAAVGYLLFSWGDIFDRVLGARLFSVLLGAVSTLFVWLFARELFRREGFLPNTAALSVALLPQFGFMSGAVNNDGLLIACASVELYLLARLLRRGPTLKLAASIGLVLALGYLAKPTMAAFGPIVAAALLWPAVRKRDPRLLAVPAVGLAGFAAVALAWTGVAALFDRGVTTVSTANTTPFSLHDYLAYVYHFYWPTLGDTTNRWFGSASPVYTVWMHSFFATFGASDTLFPERVYKVLTGICIGVAVLIGVAAWRERRAAKRALPLIVMGAGVVVSLLLLVHLTFYLVHPGYPGEQGRYLLPLGATLRRRRGRFDAGPRAPARAVAGLLLCDRARKLHGVLVWVGVDSVLHVGRRGPPPRPGAVMSPPTERLRHPRPAR